MNESMMSATLRQRVILTYVRWQIWSSILLITTKIWHSFYEKLLKTRVEQGSVGLKKRGSQFVVDRQLLNDLCMIQPLMLHSVLLLPFDIFQAGINR